MQNSAIPSTKPLITKKKTRPDNAGYNELQYSPKSDRPWQCSLCTYENSDTDNICEMCHNLRSTHFISASVNRTGEIRTHSEPMEILRLGEEEIALTKWEQIVQYCKQVRALREVVDCELNENFSFQHKKLFVDESFPPTPKSLFYSPNDNKEGHVVKWRRPKDIPVDNNPDKSLAWAVFRTPLPSDISQGANFHDRIVTVVIILSLRCPRQLLAA